MKTKCKICGIIESENTDMCDPCFESINILDSIQRMAYNFKDSREGTAIAKMLEGLAGVTRDKVTSRITRIDYVKGGNGERMPGLMHSPFMHWATDKYSHPSGLLKFISELLTYFDMVVKKDKDLFLKMALLYCIPHAIAMYQYLDPNGSGKPFKRIPGRRIIGETTILAVNNAGIKLTDIDVKFMIDDPDRITGMGANVLAGILTLARSN